MRFKIILLILIVLVFSFPKLAIIYLDNIITDSHEDMQLFVYLFNNQENVWQMAWNEVIVPRNFKKGELPCYDLSGYGQGVLIALQGQAIYYTRIPDADEDINITFINNSIIFNTIDPGYDAVTDIDIHFSCYIPEMYDYFDICILKPDIRLEKNGEVVLKYINPDYQYKIYIEGADVYPREIIFSSKEEIRDESVLDNKGNVLSENAVFVIGKNCIYGYFHYEDTYIKPNIKIIDLYYYETADQIKPTGVTCPSFDGRFYIVVPESYCSERLCIVCSHPLTDNTLFFHDMFISQEPYDLYLNVGMAVRGTIANRDIDFPVQIKCKLYYSHEHVTIGHMGNWTRNHDLVQTDDNGNFLIPIFFPKIFDLRRPAYNPKLLDLIKDERAYLDLYVMDDSTTHSYRQNFDNKLIKEIREDPQVLDLGEVYFEEGVNISGKVIDNNYEPVDKTLVFISYPYLYYYYANALSERGIDIEPGFESDYLEIIDYTSRFSKSSNISVQTDERGHFHIDKKEGIIPGVYDVYLLHDSYVLTCFPDINIKKDMDLGTLIISNGNRLRINILTNIPEENIEVRLNFIASNNILPLESKNEQWLTYYTDGLIPFKRYNIQIYVESEPVREMDLSFEYDERDILKTFDIIL